MSSRVVYHIRVFTGARVLAAALVAAALVAAACSDEAVSNSNREPPVVTIEAPVAGDTLGRTTSYFVRVEDDDGVQLFCSSIQVTIGGTDFSSLFREGCDPVRHELRVATGRILLSGCAGGVKEYVLFVRVTDAYGTSGSSNRRFWVRAGVGDPVCGIAPPATTSRPG